MSAVEFDSIMATEIDRVDDLFNEEPARYYVHVDNPLLELPGLAIIASRTSALRRELLATIATWKMPHLNREKPKESLLLMPNFGAQVFVRQMLASISRVDFEGLDEGALSDDDWPRLTSGVNLLAQGSDDDNFVEDPRFRMITESLSVKRLIELVGETTPGATVILENYHLLRGLADSGSALSDLRNAAVDAGAHVYIGCGLSHWHEVRDKASIYLSDLSESMSDAVHIADLITILVPSASGARAMVFDARYSAPWKGAMSRLMGAAS